MSKAKNGLKNKQPSGILRHKELIETGLMFAALAVFLNLAVMKLGTNGHLFLFELFTVKSAGYLMNLAGIRVDINGNTLLLPKEVWRINTECTGLFIMIIFTSFVIAFKADIKQKIVAGVIGIPAIFAANILRLFGLAYLSQRNVAIEKIFHDYVWQVAFMLIIVVFWLIWIDWLFSNETKTSISK